MNEKKSPDKDEHLVTVLKLHDAVEAELVKNTLRDHDIAAEVENVHQGGLTGTLPVDIWVRESDLNEAREIIKIHHPHLLQADE